MHYQEPVGVAEGSIRLGILKVVLRPCWTSPPHVAEGSIRLGILKVIAGLDQVVRPAELQRARSDWGY